MTDADGMVGCGLKDRDPDVLSHVGSGCRSEPTSTGVTRHIERRFPLHGNRGP